MSSFHDYVVAPRVPTRETDQTTQSEEVRRSLTLSGQFGSASCNYKIQDLKTKQKRKKKRQWESFSTAVIELCLTFTIRTLFYSHRVACFMTTISANFKKYCKPYSAFDSTSLRERHYRKTNEHVPHKQKIRLAYVATWLKAPRGFEAS